VDLDLKDKRAIVTGGSRGIGLAIARALAAEGCDVALVARDAVALEAARDAVSAESGRRVLGVSADTGSEQSVRDMVRAVVTDFGGVDILVNAAARVNTGAAVGVDGFDEAEFSDRNGRGSRRRRSSGGLALLWASAGSSPLRRWRRSWRFSPHPGASPSMATRSPSAAGRPAPSTTSPSSRALVTRLRNAAMVAAATLRRTSRSRPVPSAPSGGR
jgi:hypothetical protein